MLKLKIDGLAEINFVRTGPKGQPPILFVHGVGLDLTWWGAQIEEFGRDHDVIAIDLPGHGLSGPLEGPLSFEVMTSVIINLIEHLETGPVHLVGISFGGMLAQTLTLTRPDLVRSLSLLATLCTFPEAVRAALRERARVARVDGMARIAQLSNERWFPADFRLRRPDVLDRATRCLLQQQPGFHASIWETIAELNLEAGLPVISCPTMVVVGAEDMNAPISAGKKIADLIAGTELHEMPGLGHFPPFEAPETFNNILRRFLTGRE